MTLNETVDLMLSDDYKDRLKAEYYQTEIRLNKLKIAIAKYKASTIGYSVAGGLASLMEQKRDMESYLETLFVRAELDGIEL